MKTQVQALRLMVSGVPVQLGSVSDCNVRGGIQLTAKVIQFAY